MTHPCICRRATRAPTLCRRRGRRRRRCSRWRRPGRPGCWRRSPLRTTTTTTMASPTSKPAGQPFYRPPMPPPLSAHALGWAWPLGWAGLGWAWPLGSGCGCGCGWLATRDGRPGGWAGPSFRGQYCPVNAQHLLLLYPCYPSPAPHSCAATGKLRTRARYETASSTSYDAAAAGQINELSLKTV